MRPLRDRLSVLELPELGSSEHFDLAADVFLRDAIQLLSDGERGQAAAHATLAIECLRAAEPAPQEPSDDPDGCSLTD